MRYARTEQLAAGVPLELRPPRNGRDYLQIENLDAAGSVTFSEDRFPVIGVDAVIPPYAATNRANVREWGASGQSADAVPQGAVWLVCATAIRVKVTESTR